VVIRNGKVQTTGIVVTVDDVRVTLLQMTSSAVVPSEPEPVLHSVPWKHCTIVWQPRRKHTLDQPTMVLPFLLDVKPKSIPAGFLVSLVLCPYTQQTILCWDTNNGANPTIKGVCSTLFTL